MHIPYYLPLNPPPPTHYNRLPPHPRLYFTRRHSPICQGRGHSFLVLLANTIVATEVVEDGTLSSLIVRYSVQHSHFSLTRGYSLQPFYFFLLAFFGATMYIAIDVALGLTKGLALNPREALASIPLFVLTSIWPGMYVYLSLLFLF